MKRTDAPAKQPKPFGVNGLREALLDVTPDGDNTASYEDGFPSVTMILKSDGGLPPKGQDMNQILYELSALCQWFSAGALNAFDSAFSGNISGYPVGAVLLSNDGDTIYINTTDANSTDPNAGGAGWKTLGDFLGDESEVLAMLAANSGAALIGTTSGNNLQEYIDEFKPLGPVAPQNFPLSGRGQFSVDPSSQAWGVAGVTVGDSNNQLQITGDDKGRIKTSSSVNGVKTGSALMFPTVENTGTFITTSLGIFPEKLVEIPSDGYESSQNSPSVIWSYDANGCPRPAWQNPLKFAAGQFSYPYTAGQGTYWAYGASTTDLISYNKNTTLSTGYTSLASWNLSSTPWNTEFKALITSTNTGDRYVGSCIVEANIQASGVTLATAANVTPANLIKYVRVKYDGLADRVYSSNAIPQIGFTLSGTTLTMWVYIPSGQSTSRICPISMGPSTAMTLTFGSTATSTAPAGIVYVGGMMLWNGANASKANNNTLVQADTHVRISGTSGTSTRTDITNGGFVWSGYGTSKSFRESCAITNPSTGVYVVTGPHSGNGTMIVQPTDLNGEQVAIARVTAQSTDKLTNTISVYSIFYSVDTSVTPPTVTRTIGPLMNLPAGTWVDFICSTTF